MSMLATTTFQNEESPSDDRVGCGPAQHSYVKSSLRHRLVLCLAVGSLVLGVHSVYSNQGLQSDSQTQTGQLEVSTSAAILSRGLKSIRAQPTVTPTTCNFSNRPRPTPLPGKKGACFTLRDEGQVGSWVENLPKVIALSPSWNYSWGSKRISDQPTNIEFVPMIWGAGSADRLLTRIATDIAPQIQAGTAKRILVFNEPDSASQSNMRVSDAVTYWPIVQALNIPLASPAAVQPLGTWMQSFVQSANSNCLAMDYIAVHWYYEPKPAAFKNQMISIYNTYKRPLLLTEFAVADWSASTPSQNKWTQAQVLSFMKSVLPWLESQSFIAGYAWYSFARSSAPGTSSALFEADGTMTALGRYYASVSTSNPYGDVTIQV